MLKANSSVEVPVRSERRTPVVMALVFLPWMVTVLYTAGGLAALNFFAYAILAFAAGYGIVTVALPPPSQNQLLILAPAVGIMAFSALTAFGCGWAFPSFGFLPSGSDWQWPG